MSQIGGKLLMDTCVCLGTYCALAITPIGASLQFPAGDTAWSKSLAWCATHQLHVVLSPQFVVSNTL